MTKIPSSQFPNKGWCPKDIITNVIMETLVFLEQVVSESQKKEAQEWNVKTLLQLFTHLTPEFMELSGVLAKYLRQVPEGWIELSPEDLQAIEKLKLSGDPFATRIKRYIHQAKSQNPSQVMAWAMIDLILGNHLQDFKIKFGQSETGKDTAYQHNMIIDTAIESMGMAMALAATPYEILQADELYYLNTKGTHLVSKVELQFTSISNTFHALCTQLPTLKLKSLDKLEYTHLQLLAKKVELSVEKFKNAFYKTSGEAMLRKFLTESKKPVEITTCSSAMQTDTPPAKANQFTQVNGLLSINDLMQKVLIHHSETSNKKHHFFGRKLPAQHKKLRDNYLNTVRSLCLNTSLSEEAKTNLFTKESKCYIAKLADKKSVRYLANIRSILGLPVASDSKLLKEIWKEKASKVDDAISKKMGL